MAIWRDKLPFRRGSTAANGGSTGNTANFAGLTGLESPLPTTTGLWYQATPYRRDLAGCIGVDKDPKMSNSGVVNATGAITTTGKRKPQTMRAVQAGATFTVTKLGLLIQFDTTAGALGVVSNATPAAAAGAICKPIDNAIPIGTIISLYDWFLVHDSGDCYISLDDNAGGHRTIAADSAVASVGSGLGGPATAGAYVVGTAQPGSSSLVTNGTASHDYVLIEVAEGLKQVEP